MPQSAPGFALDKRLSSSFKSLLERLRPSTREHSHTHGSAAAAAAAACGTAVGSHNGSRHPSEFNLNVTAVNDVPASTTQPPLSDTVVHQQRSLSTGQVPLAGNVAILQRAWSTDARQGAIPLTECSTPPAAAAVQPGTVTPLDGRREQLARLWAQAGPNSPVPSSSSQPRQAPATTGAGRSYSKGGVQYTVVPDGGTSTTPRSASLQRTSASSAGSAAGASLGRRSCGQLQPQLLRLSTGAPAGGLTGPLCPSPTSLTREPSRFARESSSTPPSSMVNVSSPRPLQPQLSGTSGESAAADTDQPRSPSSAPYTHLQHTRSLPSYLHHHPPSPTAAGSQPASSDSNVCFSMAQAAPPPPVPTDLHLDKFSTVSTHYNASETGHAVQQEKYNNSSTPGWEGSPKGGSPPNTSVLLLHSAPDLSPPPQPSFFTCVNTIPCVTTVLSGASGAAPEPSVPAAEPANVAVQCAGRSSGEYAEAEYACSSGWARKLSPRSLDGTHAGSLFSRSTRSTPSLSLAPVAELPVHLHASAPVAGAGGRQAGPCPNIKSLLASVTPPAPFRQSSYPPDSFHAQGHSFRQRAGSATDAAAAEHQSLPAPQHQRAQGPLKIADEDHKTLVNTSSSSTERSETAAPSLVSGVRLSTHESSSSPCSPTQHSQEPAPLELPHTTGIILQGPIRRTNPAAPAPACLLHSPFAGAIPVSPPSYQPPVTPQRIRLALPLDTGLSTGGSSDGMTPWQLGNSGSRAIYGPQKQQVQDPFLRQAWHPLGNSADLPTGHLVALASGLWDTEGRLHAAAQDLDPGDDADLMLALRMEQHLELQMEAMSCELSDEADEKTGATAPPDHNSYSCAAFVRASLTGGPSVTGCMTRTGSMMMSEMSGESEERESPHHARSGPGRPLPMRDSYAGSVQDPRPEVELEQLPFSSYPSSEASDSTKRFARDDKLGTSSGSNQSSGGLPSFGNSPSISVTPPAIHVRRPVVHHFEQLATPVRAPLDFQIQLGIQRTSGEGSRLQQSPHGLAPPPPPPPTLERCVSLASCEHCGAICGARGNGSSAESGAEAPSSHQQLVHGHSGEFLSQLCCLTPGGCCECACGEGPLTVAATGSNSCTSGSVSSTSVQASSATAPAVQPQPICKGETSATCGTTSCTQPSSLCSAPVLHDSPVALSMDGDTLMGFPAPQERPVTMAAKFGLPAACCPGAACTLPATTSASITCCPERPATERCQGATAVSCFTADCREISGLPPSARDAEAKAPPRETRHTASSYHEAGPACSSTKAAASVSAPAKDLGPPLSASPFARHFWPLAGWDPATNVAAGATAEVLGTAVTTNQWHLLHYSQQEEVLHEQYLRQQQQQQDHQKLSGGYDATTTTDHAGPSPGRQTASATQRKPAARQRSFQLGGPQRRSLHPAVMTLLRDAVARSVGAGSRYTTAAWQHTASNCRASDAHRGGGGGGDTHSAAAFDWQGAGRNTSSSCFTRSSLGGISPGSLDEWQSDSNGHSGEPGSSPTSPFLTPDSLHPWLGFQVPNNRSSNFLDLQQLGREPSKPHSPPPSLLHYQHVRSIHQYGCQTDQNPHEPLLQQHQRQHHQSPHVDVLHSWDLTAGDMAGEDDYFPEVSKSAPQLQHTSAIDQPDASPADLDHVSTGSAGTLFTEANRNLPHAHSRQVTGRGGTFRASGSLRGSTVPLIRQCSLGSTAPGLAWMLLAAQSVPAPVQHVTGQAGSAGGHLLPQTLLNLDHHQDHQLSALQQQQQQPSAFASTSSGFASTSVRRDPVVTLRTISTVPPPAPSAHHMLVKLHHQGRVNSLERIQDIEISEAVAALDS